MIKLKDFVLNEKKEYKDFFIKMLDKQDKGIDEMSEEEKKEFFNAIKREWPKNESLSEENIRLLVRKEFANSNKKRR